MEYRWNQLIWVPLFQKKRCSILYFICWLHFRIMPYWPIFKLSKYKSRNIFNWKRQFFCKGVALGSFWDNHSGKRIHHRSGKKWKTSSCRLRQFLSTETSLIQFWRFDATRRNLRWLPICAKLFPTLTGWKRSKLRWNVALLCSFAGKGTSLDLKARNQARAKRIGLKGSG